MLLWLVGCIDYRPFHFGHGRDTDASDPPAAETCNGVDDDDDGVVDDGLPDDDGDGQLDCYECDVPAAAPTTLSNLPDECRWTWSGGDVWSALSVSRTGDRLDEYALPVVGSYGGRSTVFGNGGWKNGSFALTSWDGTTLRHTTLDLDNYADSTLTIDEQLVVAAADDDAHLALFSGRDLDLLWTSDATLGSSGNDVDEWSPVPFWDGGLMFAVSYGVFTYPDGTFVHAPYVDGRRAWMAPSIVDLDLDGSADIVDSCRVFDTAGHIESWVSYGNDDILSLGCLHAVVQADDDPEGEVVWSSFAGGLQVVDTDGTPLRELEGPELEPAAPCAGDFDGDGRMDLAVTDAEGLAAWHLDTGEQMWRLPLDLEPGTLDQCTVFDFDADGAYEVVVSDRGAVRIVDGATGSELLTIPQNTGTYDNYVAIADVDDDGSADLIVGRASDDVASGTPSAALEIYSNPDHAWPPAAPIWPWATWSGAGEWSDGTVWETPPTPWLDPGLFRGQPPVFRDGSDLSPEIVDDCEATGTAPKADVRLAVRIDNAGPREAPAGAPLAVYVGDGQGGWTLDRVLKLPDALSPDTGSATFDVRLDRADAEKGVRLVAGDDGQGGWTWTDCDATDDEVTWTPPS